MKGAIEMAAARIGELSPPGPDEPPIHPIIACLRSTGLLAMCAPAEFGGTGLAHHPANPSLLVEALAGIGGANLSAGRLFEGHVNAVKLVALHATGERRRRWLRDVAGGALFGVWGADRGEPVRLRGDGRLVGEKIYASGADVLDYAIVSARDADQKTVLLVLGAERLNGRLHPAEWSMTGMRATASGRCDLNDLRVGPDDFLGGPDDYTREPHFQGGVWRYGAVQFGAMRAIARAAAAHLTARGHQSAPRQTARLRRIVSACETSGLWLHRAAKTVERAGAPPSSHTASVLARLVVADEAAALLGATDAALGAPSFATSHPVERRRRDLQVYLRQANPDGLEHAALQTVLEDLESRRRWHLA